MRTHPCTEQSHFVVDEAGDVCAVAQVACAAPNVPPLVHVVGAADVTSRVKYNDELVAVQYVLASVTMYVPANPSVNRIRLLPLLYDHTGGVKGAYDVGPGTALTTV